MGGGLKPGCNFKFVCVARDGSAREAEEGEGFASFADRFVAANDKSPQVTVRRVYGSGFGSGSLVLFVCLFVFLTTY